MSASLGGRKHEIFGEKEYELKIAAGARVIEDERRLEGLIMPRITMYHAVEYFLIVCKAALDDLVHQQHPTDDTETIRYNVHHNHTPSAPRKGR